MMTSSNGNFSRVTGNLGGEFTGPRWIPHTKDQLRGALMFTLICARINGWVNTREAGDLRSHRTHYNVIVMYHSHHWYSLSTINDLKQYTFIATVVSYSCYNGEQLKFLIYSFWYESSLCRFKDEESTYRTIFLEMLGKYNHYRPFSLWPYRSLTQPILYCIALIHHILAVTVALTD